MDQTTAPVFKWFPIDLVALWVVLASLLAIGSLMLEVYSSAVVLGVSLAPVLALIWWRRDRIEWRDARLSRGFWIILAFAFLFRINPFLYFSAGQDQGLYMLMSKTFEKTGGLNYIDEYREELKKKSHLHLRLYDKYESGRANMLPLDAKISKYQYAYYPLSAAWLSIFGRILGTTSRPYSLVFFGLLSVIGVYLLTRELVPDPRASYLAMMLLAFNPYHVFFSKFPASEITAVGFTMLGFYYLARFWRTNQINPTRALFFGIMGCLLMLGFFLTRISGFIYVPFFYLIWVFSFIAFKDKKPRLTAGAIWTLLFGLLILSSLFYAEFYRKTLFYPTYDDLLFRRLGENPILKTWILCALLIISPPFVAKLVERLPWKEIARWAVPFGVTLAIAISTYYFALYEYGFLTKEEMNTNQKVYLWLPGVRKLTQWPLVTVFYMLSPFATGALLWFCYSRAHTRHLGMLFVCSLFVFFFGLIVGHNQYDFYHNYYIRYYIVEVLPAATIICGVALAYLIASNDAKVARRGRVLACLAVGWAAGLSAYQIGSYEGPLFHFYERVERRVGKSDLLVFYRLPTSKEIFSPFRHFYEFDKNLVLNKKEELRSKIFQQMARSAGRAVIITPERDLDKMPRIKSMGDLNFEFDYMTNTALHLYGRSFGGSSTYNVKKGFARFMPVPTHHNRKSLRIFLYEYDTKL